ncbi:RAI1 like PD-XK nuclease-domain-containing protein [Mycena maculata]|uniref:Decapping nuclease n=1 Tax=Mycena maculata TaxID=230809 RepID=A0AAD7NIX1_9AGAR|nr:RAI1 like PD-XK nuclease-domain-containing protein [Mycena maculata]
MSKRNISDLLNGEEGLESEQPPATRQRRRSPSPAATHKLSYPDPSSDPRPPPAFQQPTQLISFSYTHARELELTDSALRYFVAPPANAQLSHAYERWNRRPEGRARIDGLLRALSAVRTKKHPALASGVGVVAWRGVITRVLTAPYEERDGWELNVMCVDGVLYFEEHLSEARLLEKNDIEPRHRRQTYFGYAFESYCTTDTPGRPNIPQNPGDPPGWGGDVDTNVQWCSVVRTKLGDTRMVIGGEVDCVRGKYTGTTETFVELKTSLVIRGPHDEAKFEKKLLKFYMQSFLLGVPEILVGFRTPAGQVTTTQTFKTVEIPRLVRGKPHAWDPAVCLRWGDAFLAFLKTHLKDAPQTRVWRVSFRPKAGVELRVLGAAGVEEVVAGEERVGFLPQWYWDEVVKPADESKGD